MSKKRIGGFKKLLESQIESISRSVEPLREAFLLSADDRMDETDAVKAETDRLIAIRLHERGQRFSEKVAAVVESIVDGSFGYCRDCGEEIDVARLAVRPMTLYCVCCKEVRERREQRERPNHRQKAARAVLVPRFA